MTTSVDSNSIEAWAIRTKLIEKYGIEEVEKRMGKWIGPEYSNKIKICPLTGICYEKDQEEK